MRQSSLFTKTRKEAPKDEVSKNAILLTRAGFIHKEFAGAYTLLPLGLRVIRNIERIIRSEMNSLGGQEITLTALQSPESWKKSDRWDDDKVDVWFKTALKNGSELGLATTHEEPLTALLTEHISSYRDLPFSAYQFQTKFRNEFRAKSGIIRGREFLMKDLYSFSRDEEEHNKFYESMKDAYTRIFSEIGIGDNTFLTFASGGSFSKYSHEFQTLTSAGEDIIHLSRENGMAVNKEVYSKEVLDDLGLDHAELEEEKAVEVGNIFTLGTRFSEALGLFYKDENGNKMPVFMGSYGIGLGRLMGTVAELMGDEKGLVWPESIAPFRIHLLVLSEDEGVRNLAEEVYKTLLENNIETLFDDRDCRAGEKFMDADLIGIPRRIIIGDKSISSGMLELVDRGTGKTEEKTIKHIVEELTAH